MHAADTFATQERQHARHRLAEDGQHLRREFADNAPTAKTEEVAVLKQRHHLLDAAQVLCWGDTLGGKHAGDAVAVGRGCQEARCLDRLAYRFFGSRFRPAPFVPPEDATGFVFRPHLINEQIIAGAGGNLTCIAVSFGMDFLSPQSLGKCQARAGAIGEGSTVLQHSCSGGNAGR
jgi:hypothetical protein